MEDQMKYSDMIPVQNFMENKREIVLRILVMENNQIRKVQSHGQYSLEGGIE